MTRVKRSVHARKKRREVLEMTRGFRGEANSNYRRAKEALLKADQYRYRDRRNRKRDFRRLWIARINAAARINDLSYSQFMHGLKLAERRAGPQGPRRHRRPRRRAVPTLRRQGPRGVGGGCLSADPPASPETGADSFRTAPFLFATPPGPRRERKTPSPSECLRSLPSTTNVSRSCGGSRASAAVTTAAASSRRRGPARRRRRGRLARARALQRRRQRPRRHRGRARRARARLAARLRHARARRLRAALGAAAARAARRLPARHRRPRQRRHRAAQRARVRRRQRRARPRLRRPVRAEGGAREHGRGLPGAGRAARPASPSCRGRRSRSTRTPTPAASRGRSPVRRRCSSARSGRGCRRSWWRSATARCGSRSARNR